MSRSGEAAIFSEDGNEYCSYWYKRLRVWYQRLTIVQIDGEASISPLARILQHRPVSSSGLTPFLHISVLVLQDPLKECHQVLQAGEVQARPVLLPAWTGQDMALGLTLS